MFRLQNYTFSMIKQAKTHTFSMIKTEEIHTFSRISTDTRQKQTGANHFAPRLFDRRRCGDAAVSCVCFSRLRNYPLYTKSFGQSNPVGLFASSARQTHVRFDTAKLLPPPKCRNTHF